MCLLSYMIFHISIVNAYKYILKGHTQNTINVLQKESKHIIKIFVINIALYTEVSYGEGGRGKRIGQRKCCQVIGLELGNEKLSLVCSGPFSFHLKKHYFDVINIQPSQWLVKETSFASLDDHPSIFFTKETAAAMSIVQRKTFHLYLCSENVLYSILVS